MGLLDNLVSYWKFDGNTHDVLGSTYCTSTNIDWDLGNIGFSAYFDGISSFVEGVNSSNLYLDPPFSYSFWVKAPTVSGSSSTYMNINGENGISLNRTSDNKFITTFSGNGNEIVSSQRIDTGDWNHVCLVVASGTESKVYVNNVDTTESSTVVSGIEYNNEPLYIGCTVSGVGHIEMSIDEFGVWDKDLTASGISYLYNNGVGTTLGGIEFSDNIFPVSINYSNKGNVDVESTKSYSYVFLNGSSSDYVDTPYIPTQEIISVAVWAILGDYSGKTYPCLISQYYPNSGDNIRICIRYSVADGQMSAAKWSGSSWNSVFDTTGNYSYDTWCHYVATYDGSTLSFYINGNLVASADDSDSPSSSDSYIRIGARWDAESYPTDYWPGGFDEVFIYDRVLSEVEIENIYNRWVVDYTGLQLYYKVNENAGGILNDSTSNSNDGVLHGGDWRSFELKDNNVSIISGTTLSTVSGTDLNLNFNIDEYCTTSGVEINGSYVDFPETEPYTSHTIENITEDTDVLVTFRDKFQYTIEASSSANGAISPDGTTTYYEFDTPTFSFIPDEGYRLLNYSVDGNSKSNNEFSYTFSFLLEDHTISSTFGLPSEYGGLVLTTESFEIDNTDETLVSGTLSKNQDYTNCVPFVSHACGNSYQFRHFTNVYFEDGKVFAERGSSSTSSSLVYVNVVEFNPSKVKVTQGNFSFAGNEYNVTVSGIDLDHSFLVFTYNSSSSSINWIDHNVRGRIENSSNIEFYRNSSNGTINGTYYLIEALDEEFKVQHLNQSMTGTGHSVEIPEEVEAHRTFFVSSYYSTRNDDQPRSCTASTSLSSNREIRSYRFSDISSVYTNVQIVEISEKGKIFVNHNRWKDVGSSTSEFIGSFPTTLSGSKVMVTTSNGNQAIRTNGADYRDIPDSFFVLKKIDSETYKGIRKTTGQYSDLSIQFIDWDGYSFDYSGSISENVSDLVKSVEHINTTLSSDKNEYYKYLPLNKNQDWQYCVPFCTYFSESNEHNRSKCDVNISEGPILTIYRSEGHVSNCEVYVEVVEFNPENVFVEKGNFFNFGTEDLVTVSGTTSSGVQDLNKSIIQFTQSVSTGTDIWAYHNIRGKFLDNSSLQFYRYISGGGMFGHYYVVEFFNDLVDIEHKAISMTSTTASWSSSSSLEEDVWPIANSIPIVSYHSARNDDQPRSCTANYYHQFPQRGYFSRFSDISGIYFNLILFKIKNISLVQKVYYSLSSGVTEDSIELQETVNYSTSVVFNSNQLSVGATDGAAPSDISSAYIKTWLSEDGTKVNLKRYGSSQRNYGYLYIVDFSKDYSYSGPYKQQSGFLNSIENINFTVPDLYKKIELGKKQNSSTCVPFISTKFSSNNLTDRMNYIVDIIDHEVYFYREHLEEDHPINLFILEFNPNKVNVQKRYFYLSGTSYDVDIDTVNLDKSFLIVTVGSDGGRNYARINTRASFVDSNTVRVQRGSSYNNVWGIFYVIESLDDSFEVYSVGGSSSGEYITLYLENFIDPMNTCLLASFYSTHDDDQPRSGTCSTYLDNYQQRIQFARMESYGDVYGNAQVIKFKDSIINKSFYIYDYMASGTTEIIFDLIDPLNENYTFLVPNIFNSSCRTGGYSVGDISGAFSMIELTGSGTQIKISRGSSSQPTYPSFNVIEFNPPNEYYFEGVVREKNVPVDRKVALYRRSTSELIDITTSSGVAGYRLETPYSDEHYVVCLDDEAGIEYNALIEDRVIGEEIFPL